MTALMANRMCSGKRSTSRPTVICATAPHRNTAVVRPPTATSEMPLPTRSSTILGSDIEMVLKTSPALSATTTNSPKIIAADVSDSDDVGRGAARRGVSRFFIGNEPEIDRAGHNADQPGTRKAPRQDNAAVSAAVMPAASETPRLPQTPLNAMVRPRWVAFSRIIAVPTG